MPPAKTLPAISRIALFQTNDEGLPILGAQTLRRALESKSPPPLSSKQLAILAWGQLQIDVSNGGFEQFFYNNGGCAGVAEAASLVEKLGFPKVAATLREAQAIYKRNAKRFETDDPWEDLFGKVPALDALGERFARSMTSPSRAIGKLLRKHISDLFVGDDGQTIDPQFTGTVSVTRNDVVVASMEVRKGKAHGAYREFFDDGSPKKAAYYENGERSSNFWPNGQVRSRKRTERGNHIYEWFFPSGALQKRMVQDKSGNNIEPVLLFYENGQVAEEVHCRGWDGAGLRRKYFEDGSLKLDAEHRKDDCHTLVVHNAWNDDRKQVVKNGTGVFFDDGKDIDDPYNLISEVMWTEEMELKGGLKHGRVTTWSDGVLFTIGTYKNGRRHGEETGYWDNGRKAWITFYKDDKELKKSRKEFPKFDNPQPAVLLEVSANDRLYTAWDHPLLDEYPRPLNLDQVQRLFKIPQFLLDVDARNRARLEGSSDDDDPDDDDSDEEQWNEFDDRAGYLLKLDENGIVTGVKPTAADNGSVEVADDYPPILRKLKFRPGRLKNRPIDCVVALSVVHTFQEPSPPTRRRGKIAGD